MKRAPIKASRFMLSLVLAMQMASTGLIAQNEPRTVKREFNKQGWLVPGIKNLDRRNARHKREQNIDGISVQITTYAPILNERVKIAAIDTSGETREREISVNQIQRYEVDGRAFCYEVVISPVENGYVIGADTIYDYYDEDGKGVFQTKELLGPLFPGWHVRLPDWVKKAYRNQ